MLATILTFGVDIFWKGYPPCFCISIIFTISYWLIFREVFFNYHEKFPSLEFEKKRLFYFASRMLAFYFGIKFGIGAILTWIFPEHVQFYEENKLTSYSAEIGEILIMILVLSFYEIAYYFNKSKKIAIEKNKLEKITAEQTLNTLKNQVNPHFLFNSLNTLVTIIPEDKDQAVKFVHELSKTYRTILEVRDEKLITIEKELEALDSYIYLLKTRFQGKIHIDNLIHDKHLSQFVLPVSLQILIENAVKHNIVSKSKPLYISIYTEDDFIVVKNNLQKKNQEFATTKVGLTNIRDRYEFMTNKKVIVQETENDFIVKLPIINHLQNENPNY